MCVMHVTVTLACHSSAVKIQQATSAFGFSYTQEMLPVNLLFGLSLVPDPSASRSHFETRR